MISQKIKPFSIRPIKVLSGCFSCLRPLNVWFCTLIASLNFQRIGADIRSQELGDGTYIKKPYVMKKIGVAIWNELDRK